MPTLYLDCPECERPLDVHTARDGPTVRCPCCDCNIEVPKPVPRYAPAVVWAAAAGLVANPVIVGLVLLIDYIPEDVVPGALIAAVLFSIPAAGLLFGKRWVWLAVLVLAAWLAVIGLAAFIPASIYALSWGGLEWAAVFACPVAGAVAGGVAGLLLLPRVRDWCDR